MLLYIDVRMFCDGDDFTTMHRIGKQFRALTVEIGQRF